MLNQNHLTSRQTLTSTMFGLLLFALLAFALDAEQISLGSHAKPDSPKRVAIIGAGIAGASAAYQLHNYHRSRLPIDITVYEAASQVGGRVKAVKVYDGLHGNQYVETGAYSFYSSDDCLQDSIDEVGLRG